MISYQLCVVAGR